MTTDTRANITTDETSLALERFYATTPDRLFQAWTDPKLVARWLAPGPMFTCKLPVYEARKGGRFRIEMSGPGPEGKPMQFAYEGTFDEIEPAKRVVMTWRVAMAGGDASPDDPPSVVTATFTPASGGTLLRLTQDAMPNKEWADSAAGGWANAMETLAGVL